MDRLQAAIARLARGETLVAAEAEAVCAEIVAGHGTPAKIAAILMGLRQRGETADEIEGFVRAMLAAAEPFDHGMPEGSLFDTCGAGGDGHGTFNVSTTAALVLAASGLPVAKHGGRAASSVCGSADLLEHWGLRLDAPKATLRRMLHETGFCFLFAPAWHHGMRHAAPVRRELRLRTIFNLCGPLASPARPGYQIIGVSHSAHVELVASALARLGRRHALVVHGTDGMDEITLTQITTGVLLRADGSMDGWSFNPLEIDLAPTEMAPFNVTSVEESARLSRGVLEGESGPAADLVNVNVAAALVLASPDLSMAQAFMRAREVQRSGKAAQVLDRAVAIGREG